MRKLALFFPVVLLGLVAAVGFLSFSGADSDDYVPTPVTGVEMNCFQETTPVSWSYCINTVSGSENQDVLYYLHARNGNETWWNDKDYHTGKLYEHWRQNNQTAPTVVSISFGKLWVLKEGEKDGKGSLYEIFTSVVIPEIETKLKQLSGKRMIAGISMGGYNTLIVSMKSKNFFAKSASICAPLPTVSHHDGLWRVISEARSSNTSFRRAVMLWQFSRSYYPEKENWRANDPLSLSESFTPDNAPAIYVTCGRKDNWGCFDGTEKFVANISAAGGAIEWVPRDGGHCDIDYASLADFLQNNGHTQN
ncbi:MAG: alpha/beta hydrolase-fold protein [Pseudomonadota bacterium]